MKYLIPLFLLSFSCMAYDISDFAHKIISERFVKTPQDSKELDALGKWFKNGYETAQSDNENITLKSFLDRKLIDIIPEVTSKKKDDNKIHLIKKIVYILHLYKTNNQEIPLYLFRIPTSALDELDALADENFTWEKLNDYFLDKIEEHGKEIEDLRQELEDKKKK